MTPASPPRPHHPSHLQPALCQGHAPLHSLAPWVYPVGHLLTPEGLLALGESMWASDVLRGTREADREALGHPASLPLPSWIPSTHSQMSTRLDFPPALRRLPMLGSPGSTSPASREAVTPAIGHRRTREVTPDRSMSRTTTMREAPRNKESVHSKGADTPCVSITLSSQSKRFVSLANSAYFLLKQLARQVR
jgi:hypothetical protein